MEQRISTLGEDIERCAGPRRALATRARARQRYSAAALRRPPSLRPLGYRLSAVELTRDPFRARLDSVRVGIGWLGAPSFQLLACGGEVNGSVVRGTAERRRRRETS
jgi:hypothetical protein